MKDLRLAPLGFLAVAGLTVMACDTTDTFTVSNSSEHELVVGLSVVDEDGHILEPNVYTIPPRTTIDTKTQEDHEGYAGGVLFSKYDSILICAYESEALIYEEVFPFKEVESKGFHFALDGTVEVESPAMCPADTDAA